MPWVLSYGCPQLLLRTWYTHQLGRLQQETCYKNGSLPSAVLVLLSSHGKLCIPAAQLNVCMHVVTQWYPQVLSEHDDDLSKALPAFEARRAGDIQALIQLMTFSAPYQYNQVLCVHTSRLLVQRGPELSGCQPEHPNETSSHAAVHSKHTPGSDQVRAVSQSLRLTETQTSHLFDNSPLAEPCA